MAKYGFLPPEILETDYLFGGQTKLKAEVLRPDGQWDSYLPVSEYQLKNGIETSNCTVYGSLNAIETLYNRLYGVSNDYSERYIGVLAETTEEGNSVNKVAEVIRKKGLIPEAVLPFNDTIKSWSAYYSPKPMTTEFLKLGENWLFFHGLGYEWVFNQYYLGDKKARLREALQISPLGISVSAWPEPKDGIYYKDGQENHWVCMYGYEEGKYWKIYDSYDDTKKKLDWNYDFRWAMRYSLWKKTLTEESKKNIIQNISEVLNIIKQKLLEISAQIKGRILGFLKGIKK